MFRCACEGDIAAFSRVDDGMACVLAGRSDAARLLVVAGAGDARVRGASPVRTVP